MTTPEDTELKLLLIDHFTNSMPIQVDRDYAEHLLDRVITLHTQEAYKKGYIAGGIAHLTNPTEAGEL